MLLDTAQRYTTQLVTGFKQSIVLVPTVWRKPTVIRHWLLHAHKAQIALFTLIIIVPFGLNPLIDLFLTTLFGTVTEEQLFGYF